MKTPLAAAQFCIPSLSVSDPLASLVLQGSVQLVDNGILIRRVLPACLISESVWCSMAGLVDNGIFDKGTTNIII